MTTCTYFRLLRAICCGVLLCLAAFPADRASQKERSTASGPGCREESGDGTTDAARKTSPTAFECITPSGVRVHRCRLSNTGNRTGHTSFS